MQCPRCQHENPLDAGCCEECGSRLAMHLAEKILISKSALEGERKQVTVLFVDVSGFTSLSERLDPEHVHQVMTRAFELMLGPGIG